MINEYSSKLINFLIFVTKYIKIKGIYEKKEVISIISYFTVILLINLFI